MWIIDVEYNRVWQYHSEINLYDLYGIGLGIERSFWVGIRPDVCPNVTGLSGIRSKNTIRPNPIYIYIYFLVYRLNVDLRFFLPNAEGSCYHLYRCEIGGRNVMCMTNFDDTVCPGSSDPT